MLSVGNAEGDGNESWDSSRGQAQHIDLSNQVPNTSGLDNSVANRSKARHNFLGAPSAQEYYANRPSHGNMSHSGSAVQLTV